MVSHPRCNAHWSDYHNLSHIMRKPVLVYANNKGADQPAHPRGLISTFVVRCLDRIKPLAFVSEFQAST